ncbi:uncharacterized protein IL334_000008 [Kwoniella shivajii]|uniref:FAD-binding domain-containing protein n=1 Tax=Kwoniella shivajii TaxID=564305 RepID=A0ABZ1CNB5_9TREE|nr:hypothetical protein IL334_000008 [Kwoniella shivajii]
MSSVASTIRSQKSVLISGGSIAGPAIAWWLHRYGFKTTLVERWSELRPGGQNIDVTNQGLEVIRKMDLESTILAANTGEKGTVLTDVKGNNRLVLPLDQGFSFTNDTEILRGEFARILYEATIKNTEWRFGDQINALEEITGDNANDYGGVNVEFKSGKKEMFDLVVIADGVGSRTRKLAFSGDEVRFKALGCYIAYFTIPLDPTEPRSDQWIVTHLPGKRCLNFRPDGQGTTKAFLMWIADKPSGAERRPMGEQIEFIKEVLLSGEDLSSPLVDRVVKGLETTDDVYLEWSGQIKAKRLSTPGGHIGMIGDAAYCGTAMSGGGTTLSLVGAYMLASELAKHADNPKAGFDAYEKWMAPFAANIQKLVPGVPHIALPATSWGIHVFHAVIRLVAWISRSKPLRWAAGFVFKDDRSEVPLPDYKEYERIVDAGKGNE